MSAAGVVLRDLVDTTNDTQTSEHTNHENITTQQPTESHALAAADHQVKGSAQVPHDQDVVDLGWNEDEKLIAAPLVGGMSNEDLWILVRRFNKQVFHLRETSKPPVGGLDLSTAEDEEFSPNKLRAQFERLYMGVFLGVLAFMKHMARLRSWRESRRTAAFCGVYFVAWVFNFLLQTLAIVSIALIVLPKARDVLFPPAPLALVDFSTGGVTKPQAGVLGTTDTATGAPENNKGEAVENEASNFVTGIGAIAMNTMTGKDPTGEPKTDEGHVADRMPEPNSIATTVAVAKDKAEGVDKPSQDKTKESMETAMWAKMRPLMHILCLVSDTWERFANALEPTPPFHQNIYRLRLASLIVPLLAAPFFVTAHMVFKGTTFAIGLGLFGDPVITPAYQWLNRTFPDWQLALNPNNTLLRGVPTNVQLTITLLRVGEANNAPLPPPPVIRESPSMSPIALHGGILNTTGGGQPLDATDGELQEAIEHDPEMIEDAGGDDHEITKSTKHGQKRSKILGFLKGSTKAAVGTTIGADKLRAKAGKESAKQRLGVVPPQDERAIAGPTEFNARYLGKKGQVYLTTNSTVPCVVFSTDSTKDVASVAERPDLHSILWSVPVTEIKELKKHSGYGFKSKLLVGWAYDREVRDGLEIVDRQGNEYVVTAIPLRDELFNRLCAMGQQKWEAW